MSISPPVRYRAAAAYVGTAFRGFQFQENAARTVQAVLEEALGVFSSAAVRVHAAGRTDAGVHADGQVIHFDLPRERDPARIRDGVNSLLPPDVRLLAIARAPESFLARRDAVWKEYVYRWSRAEVIPPRDAPFVAELASSARVEPVRRAAASLEGRHDFSAFGVRLPRGESAVRRLHFVRIEESGGEIRAVFRGDAFLRGMVRSICGVLAHVARGKAPEDRIARLLDEKDPRLLAPKAPAHGLTLSRVAYVDDPFGVTPDVE
ncbi:MAG TPA: tRNA pseudouridine(38-40) synthase TruA [Thermoanaerobaculia bacterium]|nr:tRNA pseudouridine(38-40) synthase TruA [Thermoanaerobaculia bacterium]